MSFPHEDTDWVEDLQSAIVAFVNIAQAISHLQPVYIICKNKEYTSSLFCSTSNMSFIEIPTNDTWIRDYGYISIVENSETKLLDFTFDGWGGKFEANLDNSANLVLRQKGYMGTIAIESVDFVLEGGSIESDGNGTILTTTQCLCNPNRNGGLSKSEIESKLNQYLGTKRILWLDYGYLAGDDTDSHIDTLARLVNEKTIVYVKCSDKSDEHYTSLKLMEKQLKTFRTIDGKAYNLIPLPMCEKKIGKNGNRLPATYANFLIINHALLYPIYDDKNDKKVGKIFRELFPDREIIAIDCLKLIEQGGSLHCSTMQVTS